MLRLPHEDEPLPKRRKPVKAKPLAKTIDLDAINRASDAYYAAHLAMQQFLDGEKEVTIENVETAIFMAKRAETEASLSRDRIIKEH